MRPAPFLPAILMACMASLCAQTTNPIVTPPTPSVEISTQILEPIIPRAGHALTLRNSIGWRDNVLLSPFAPIGRSFARAELEALLFRDFADWKLVSFVSGDVLRYFSPPPETSGEQQWFGHVEMRWQHWPEWRAAIKADGFLQDAVIDLSETENVRTIVPTRAQGGFATVSTRVALPYGFAVEPMVQAKRVEYRSFPGDYTETKGGTRLEWKRSNAFTLSALWAEHDRSYSERTQYTVGGRALKGTHLRFWQREAEVKASTAWANVWTMSLALGHLENSDRASGFFDYTQNRAAFDVVRVQGSWKFVVSGEAKRIRYLRQTVGAGIAPPARVADNYETSFRAERELAQAWTIFVEYRWERSRSNETDFSYRANSVQSGIQRNF